MMIRHFPKIEGDELNATLRTLCRVASVLRTTPIELPGSRS